MSKDTFIGNIKHVKERMDKDNAERKAKKMKEEEEKQLESQEDSK